MKKICVYGSLRPGEYNFERFQSYYPEDIKPLGTYKILGFDLYDLGSYPGVKLSDDKEQPLTIDILECGEACFNSINRMEVGAGYYPHNLNIDGHECIMYIYDHHTNKRVDHGDWSKYIQEKKQIKENAEYI